MSTFLFLNRGLAGYPGYQRVNFKTKKSELFGELFGQRVSDNTEIPLAHIS